MNNLLSISLFWPELLLTATILIAIIVDIFSVSPNANRISNCVIIGLLATLAAVFLTDHSPTTLFMDSLAFDPFASFIKSIVLVSTLLIVVISRYSNEFEGYHTGEYYALLCIMVFGMFLMASAIDLITVYLSIEVVSLMSFILAGYLKNDPRSNEASLKYVIYGAFSSGIMLYGLSIIFGLTGTTKFFAIRDVIATLDSSSNLALTLSTIFVLAGFGYKISAVPFHFWTPDVYEGSPTPITAYLSVAPKAAGFALMIRFFNQVLVESDSLSTIGWYADVSFAWPGLLGVISVVTMTMGNLVAIQQNSVKRMLAYSSIAHAGYMLMVFPTISSEGVFAVMIYLVMYLFMNLGAFFVLIYVVQKEGGENFEHFSGLGWRMPIVGIVMTVFMFSLTGLPPTVGFIGKFYLFVAIINAGPSFYWIAFFGAINTVVSLYYYMRVVKTMYLDGKPSEEIIVPPFSMTLIFFVLAIPSVFFGIYWTPILNWVKDSLLFFVQI
ncbi:MAG: NADH-quinone oxidoreductase subunit N [Candidatus Neomarinimicrobiota bacterium]|nr:NADH-quinone oxidoreductase subunit N [Candidatus Neomarinimicrobiota bacterium]